MRFAIWSILLFTLLMAFLYYDPVLYYLLGWIGSRAFVPYVTLAMFGASAYCSVRFLHQSYTTKNRSTLGLLMALPIFIWLAWWLIKLVTRSYLT
jgi:hypothetical protein